ncbi:hypothetical protein [Geodermatophilus africanus]|uniref:CYTH domain-containing protein n=1 Tax=Geodermatophilus africanus TaxID=1137993 RepID=UPI001114E6B2|nr:hypothetical protein [Geodermatophilus africanus]
MATRTEHERRYLVHSLEDVPGLDRRHGHELIVQGYLASHDGATLRIRRRMGMRSETGPPLYEAIGSLEYKGPRQNAARLEHDWPVPDHIAPLLMRLAAHIIRKRRFSIVTSEGPWDIDEFLGENSGLIIAEFESEQAVRNLRRPEWCYSEITPVRDFDNEQLAMRPISMWPASDLEKYKLLPKAHQD